MPRRQPFLWVGPWFYNQSPMLWHQEGGAGPFQKADYALLFFSFCSVNAILYTGMAWFGLGWDLLIDGTRFGELFRLNLKEEREKERISSREEALMMTLHPSLFDICKQRNARFHAFSAILFLPLSHSRLSLFTILDPLRHSGACQPQRVKTGF